MPTTTKMGIVYPSSTDLVKDGATAMGTISTTVDAKTGLVLLNTTTFSAVSSISLPTSTFNTNFKNYRLVFTLTSVSADMTASLRFRTAGTDNSSATYVESVFGTSTYTSSGFAGYVASTDTSAQFILAPKTATNLGDLTLDIINPFETRRTSFSGFGVSGLESRAITGYFNNTTSFDSATIIASTGNFTGSFSIYGYNL
jgi:hypothetical protein